MGRFRHRENRHERASTRRLRTAVTDLRDSIADLRALLSNVSSGCVTLDAKGRIGPERTAWFDEWFGAPGTGATLWGHLAPLAPEFATATELAWQEVQDGYLPAALTLAQLPTELMIDECVFRFLYRAIGTADPPDRVLVVVDDVSAECARKRADRDAAELTHFVETLLENRATASQFVRATTQLLDGLDHHIASPPPSLARDLHTLKGNAGCYGLESIAAAAHVLESAFETRGRLPGDEVARLADRWRQISQAVAPLLATAEGLVVDEEGRAELSEAIHRHDPTRALLGHVRALTLEPVERRLKGLAEQATAVASRLGKDVEVQIEGNGVRLDPTRWAALFPPLVHAVRNAVDHGIEPPEQRVAAGKPARGTLLLRARAHGRDLFVEILDDGRGVDVNRLIEKARAKSLAVPDDPLELVFVAGLSTAARVTDVSGRGVGMDAVADTARALGGMARFRSVPGVGSTLSLTFIDALSDDEAIAGALLALKAGAA